MNPFAQYRHTPIPISEIYGEYVQLGWVTDLTPKGSKVLLAKLDTSHLTGDLIVQFAAVIHEIAYTETLQQIENGQRDIYPTVVVWGVLSAEEVHISGELLESVSRNRGMIQVNYMARIIIVTQKRVVVMTMITMLIGLAADRQVRVEFAPTLRAACVLAGLPPLQ